jgi:hypothetical protein
MTSTFVDDGQARAAAREARPAQVPAAKALYFSLLDNPAGCRDAARAYLAAQIEVARAEPCELPDAVWQLQGWIQGRAEAVGFAYR